MGELGEEGGQRVGMAESVRVRIELARDVDRQPLGNARAGGLKHSSDLGGGAGCCVNGTRSGEAVADCNDRRGGPGGERKVGHQEGPKGFCSRHGEAWP